MSLSNWSDPSAVWHIWSDLSLNNSNNFSGAVSSLAYDSCNNIMFAGGLYSSNANGGSREPFIVYNTTPSTNPNNWSDPSALWQNPNWSDLSLNGDGYVSSLAYDSCNNIMFAGGYYSSIANGGIKEPFIVYNTTPSTNPNNWSDPSALWHNPNWSDLSLNGGGEFYGAGTVSSLAYDSCNNIMFAGGYYSSIANSGVQEPFIVYNNTNPNNWSDPSALWHTWSDLSLNGGGYVSSLAYDSCNNIMFAGGYYSSIANGGIKEPFIVYNTTPSTNPNNWSDPSALWHIWSDLSLNGGGEFYGGGIVSSLAYDSSNNIMFAGGYYSSIANLGNIEPFIVYNNTNPNNWSDPSALWHTWSGSDLSLNNGGSVRSLAYDSCNNIMFACGIYSSIANGGFQEPFIVYNNTPSTNPNNWSDPSAVWHTWSGSDLSLNGGGNVVNCLAYDSSSNTMFSGGYYSSIANDGASEPFIVYNTIDEPLPCYLKGTRILTQKGYVAVENLKKDDKVVTKGKLHKNQYLLKDKFHLEPIVWINHFKVKQLNEETYPICIKKNALGKNYPNDDLYVSPNHGVIVKDKLVPTRHLLNGQTIYQDCSYTQDNIIYYHLELEAHTAIVANGLLSETYLDNGNRRVFRN